jgi:hypothetical protein
MAKVVKGIGRAVSGVVKGVTKAVSGVVKGVTNAVKKIVSSPIGKAILMAGAVYFGGAAIMGAMGGASAGTGIMGTLSGGLKGAMAGIGNAWTGLKAAGGAAMAGNFGQAGSSLWGGMSGAYSAGQGAVATLAQPAGGLLTQQTTNGYNLAFQPGGAAPAVPAGGAPAAGGDLAKAVTRSAMINAGSQLAGNVMTGMAEEAKYKEELKQEALARQRHNDNVGARLFADGQYQGEFDSSSNQPAGLLFSGGHGYGQYYQHDPNNRQGFRAKYA